MDEPPPDGLLERRNHILKHLTWWWVGPDGDPSTINTIGQWRGILNKAAERIAILERQVDNINASLGRSETDVERLRTVVTIAHQNSSNCICCGRFSVDGHDDDCEYAALALEAE